MFLSGLMVCSAVLKFPLVLHRVFFQQVKDVHYRFLKRLPTPTEVCSSTCKLPLSLSLSLDSVVD